MEQKSQRISSGVIGAISTTLARIRKGLEVTSVLIRPDRDVYLGRGYVIKSQTNLYSTGASSMNLVSDLVSILRIIWHETDRIESPYNWESKLTGSWHWYWYWRRGGSDIHHVDILLARFFLALPGMNSRVPNIVVVDIGGNGRGWRPLCKCLLPTGRKNRQTRAMETSDVVGEYVNKIE